MPLGTHIVVPVDLSARAELVGSGGLLVWRGTYPTARSVIAVEVVSLLLIAALIVVIFTRLGAETLRATRPGALCSHASTGNGLAAVRFA